MSRKETLEEFHPPVWDRGEEIDAEMLRFTIGDDWAQDRRLVEVDLQGSLAHAAGLARVGILSGEEHPLIRDGLMALRDEYHAGAWNVEPGDEDVHSAIERRLVSKIGEAGKKLHTGRSRNDQVATDMRLWLRKAAEDTEVCLNRLADSIDAVASSERGALPIPGYTHLRRAMPSSIADWLRAHVAALRLDASEFDVVRQRVSRCPLGSGAGYGVPIELDRAFVAEELGFEGPEEPVTSAQHARGRAELSYVTALESIAIDLGKLMADLWLYSSAEFGFVHLPVPLSTGSSLMPHKRNPDLIELIRGQCRQVVSDRMALVDVLRDLPSGYHRDFQLVKPPLFRAHDRVASMLPLVAKLLGSIEFAEGCLRAADADPSLRITGKVLERAAAGEAFRDVYREASR